MAESVVGILGIKVSLPRIDSVSLTPCNHKIYVVSLTKFAPTSFFKQLQSSSNLRRKMVTVESHVIMPQIQVRVHLLHRSGHDMLP